MYSMTEDRNKIALDRIELVKGHYNFGEDVQITRLGKREFREYIDNLGNFYVVRDFTFHIGKYYGEEDMVVWVDPEGLDFGWIFTEYQDEDGNIDYREVEKVLKRNFYTEVNENNQDTNIEIYEVKSKTSNIKNILMVDVTYVPKDEAVECLMYGLAKNLEDGLE